MIDMAVGIMMGGAFTGVVKSIVGDILMPPLGLLLNEVDCSNLFIVLKEGVQPVPYVALAQASITAYLSIRSPVF